MTEIFDDQGNLKGSSSASSSSSNSADGDAVENGSGDAKEPKSQSLISNNSISSSDGGANSFAPKWSVSNELCVGGLASIFGGVGGGFGVTYFGLSPTKLLLDAGGSTSLSCASCVIL